METISPASAVLEHPSPAKAAADSLGAPPTPIARPVPPGPGLADVAGPPGNLPAPAAIADLDTVPRTTAAEVEHLLKEFFDSRVQKWILYMFLLVASGAFLGLFFWIVRSAWSEKTQPAIIALGALPASGSALIAAVVAAVVAIPLSLSIALSKLVTSPKTKERGDDPAPFTSALFELGKAFSQGFKSLKD